MSQPIHIGQILVEQGVLSEQQVFEILQVQKRDHKPFGVLAERLFDVLPDSIEQAWIEQYHRFTGTIDLADQRFDDRALKLINRRQAWQFEVLPLHFDSGGELLVAASRRRLARSVTFLVHKLEPVVYVRVAESSQLRQFLRQYYPMPEVSDELIAHARHLAEG